MRWFAPLGLAFVACWSSSTPSVETPVVTAKPAMKLACSVTLADLGLDEEPTDEQGEPGTVAAFPYTPTSVLAAVELHGHYGAPGGTSTLYEVDCASRTARVMLTEEGALFAHGAMTADASTLFYTGDPGIKALDLATKRRRTVTKPPVAESCWEMDETQLRDVVTKLLDGDEVLAFTRGGPCGFEGDWEAERLFLDHPRTPGGKPRDAKPVGEVAVDAGGALWASRDACRTPELYRSTDRGDHWTKIALPEDAPGSPMAILPDATRPGFVAVVASSCDAPDLVTGELFVTRDGGRSWMHVALPDVETDYGMEGHQELRVTLGGGSVDKLTIWSGDSDDPVAWRSVKPLVAVDAADESVWKLVDPTPKLPPPQPKLVKIGDATFTTSDDGLLRTRGSEPAKRLYPY